MSAVATTTPAGTTRPSRPSFPGLVRGEIIKLRRQLSLWLMVGGGILLLGLVFLIELASPFANIKKAPAQYDWTAMNVFAALFNTGSGIVLLIVASRLLSMEYSGGTIRVVLARGVGRVQLLLAKIATLLLVAAGLLVGYLVLAAIAFYAMVAIAGGSLSTQLSIAHLGQDFGIYVLIACISCLADTLLAIFVAVVGRSLAFGIAAAMAYFPAENFGSLILFLVNRLTHQEFWLWITAYLLGPNLNQLSSVMITDHRSFSVFQAPLVKVDATHSLVVIGVYCAIFMVASIVLSVRRDVLQ